MNKKDLNIDGFRHILYQHSPLSKDQMQQKSTDFYKWMDQRRSIREFSDKNVSKSVIENIIKTASTAPSGAHKQPWTFCAISNKDLKHQIRLAAEAEEKETYENRMGERWKNDLAPIATDMYKPFLEIAPWLIIACKRPYEYRDDGEQSKQLLRERICWALHVRYAYHRHPQCRPGNAHPYPESDAISDQRLLERPENERAFLLLPVGYPKAPCIMFLILKRKDLE